MLDWGWVACHAHGKLCKIVCKDTVLACSLDKTSAGLAAVEFQCDGLTRGFVKSSILPARIKVDQQDQLKMRVTRRDFRLPGTPSELPPIASFPTPLVVNLQFGEL